MNKIAIIYASIHHQNTIRLLEGISEKCEVNLINIADVEKVNLLEFDVLGFASGIYNGEFHKSIIDFIKNNPVLPDKFFTIHTSGSGNQKYANNLISQLEKNNHILMGIFHCKGYDTYGLWKWIGGISKGHPTQNDMEECIKFIKHQIV